MGINISPSSGADHLLNFNEVCTRTRKITQFPQFPVPILEGPGADGASHFTVVDNYTNNDICDIILDTWSPGVRNGGWGRLDDMAICDSVRDAFVEHEIMGIMRDYLLGCQYISFISIVSRGLRSDDPMQRELAQSHLGEYDSGKCQWLVQGLTCACTYSAYRKELNTVPSQIMLGAAVVDLQRYILWYDTLGVGRDMRYLNGVLKEELVKAL